MSTALLKPHPGRAARGPKVPVGITVQLDHAAAQAALAAVPRLQRKHYESLPKSLKEMDFWTNFFTHLTVIVREAKPELLAGEPLDWKGVAPGDGPNSFDAVWAELPAEKRAAVEAMCAKDATALLTPSTKSPAAFPVVPLGVEVFVDGRRRRRRSPPSPASRRTLLPRAEEARREDLLGQLLHPAHRHRRLVASERRRHAAIPRPRRTLCEVKVFNARVSEMQRTMPNKWGRARAQSTSHERTEILSSGLPTVSTLAHVAAHLRGGGVRRVEDGVRRLVGTAFIAATTSSRQYLAGDDVVGVERAIRGGREHKLEGAAALFEREEAGGRASALLSLFVYCSALSTSSWRM